MAKNLVNEIAAEQSIITDTFMKTAEEKFGKETMSFDYTYVEDGRAFHHFWYGAYEFEARVTGSNNDRAWITRSL